jgi:tripartite-type tricarboxylate transporter receptor subunit TctC
VALAAAAFRAGAQDFPGSKPITIIVPFAAGGPTDKVARDLAEALRKPLGGATVIVDNAAGAGGSIGANKVAKAPRRRLHAAGPPHRHGHHAHAGAQHPLQGRKRLRIPGHDQRRAHDADRQALAAGQQLQGTGGLAGRQNKGKINLGNAGVGSASHLCGMLFQHAVGVDMTAVPYKGTGPAMTDLMGGQIDLMCDQTTNTTSVIEGKKVKAFAVTSPKRLTVPALKDLPTMQEVGVKDFNVSIFHGLYAPKGTPRRC